MTWVAFTSTRSADSKESRRIVKNQKVPAVAETVDSFFLQHEKSFFLMILRIFAFPLLEVRV